MADVVVVTGSGGSGCGRAVAARFAARGAPVIVSDINDEGGDETVRLIEKSGGKAAFFHADVGEERQARDLISFAEQRFGHVSVLINNATEVYPNADGLQGWRGSLQTDLMGTLYATQWAIESMRRGSGGAIVNMASMSALWHGRRTPGGSPGYDVAKLGVIRLTTNLSRAIPDPNIRMNCLAPGWIASDAPRRYWESLTPAERLKNGVPACLIAVEDVAQMVERLATDQSLNGRIVVWWSEGCPRLIQWGDRGYRNVEEMPALPSATSNVHG